MTPDTIQELAQKLYNDDGHAGNVYKKAPVEMLRYYEYKAQGIIDAPSNCEPAWLHLQNSVLRR